MCDDIQLINNVKSRPELYDTAHLKYMDTHYKNILWKEIASDMGVDVVTCKSRWCNIRDNFRRSLKKAMLNKTNKSVKHYKYAKNLQFLLKFFVCDEIGENHSLDESDFVTNSDVKIEEESLSQIDFQETCYDGDSHCPSPLEPTPKRRKISQEYMEHTHSSANSSPQHYNLQKSEYDKRQSECQTRSSLSDPVDAFLAGLAPTLKTFSPINWHHAKSEIFAVVQKYELKTIIGDANLEL